MKWTSFVCCSTIVEIAGRFFVMHAVTTPLPCQIQLSPCECATSVTFFSWVVIRWCNNDRGQRLVIVLYQMMAMAIVWRSLVKRWQAKWLSRIPWCSINEICFISFHLQLSTIFYLRKINKYSMKYWIFYSQRLPLAPTKCTRMEQLTPLFFILHYFIFYRVLPPVHSIMANSLKAELLVPLSVKIKTFFFEHSWNFVF